MLNLGKIRGRLNSTTCLTLSKLNPMESKCWGTSSPVFSGHGREWSWVVLSVFAWESGVAVVIRLETTKVQNYTINRRGVYQRESTS